MSLVTPLDSRRRATASWVLYDFANTIFSLNIVSMFLPVWVVNVAGGSDGDWAVANSLSMFVVFLLAPIAGAFADRTGRRLLLLAFSTLACVALTVSLGRGSLTTTLVAFAFANIAYQLGLQFYDALLPVVAAPDRRGRIGGIGIGAGYLGALLGILIGRVLLGATDGLDVSIVTARYQRVFVATGGLFLLFAAPAFVWIREPRTEAGIRASAVGESIAQAWETIRHLHRLPTLRRFLIARAFYTDAINTVIAFMGIYVTNAVGFSASEAQIVLALAIVFAAVGGFLWGRIVDRLGPKRTLDRVLGLWMVTLAWAAAVGFFPVPPAAFWPVPIAAGIALGGTWTADRPLLLALAPRGRIGEYAGLYGMVSRFAAILGPLMWRVVAEDLGWGRPAAIASLLLFVVVGFAVLRPVADGTNLETQR
jgi:UMF1 family MFS transporter